MDNAEVAAASVALHLDLGSADFDAAQTQEIAFQNRVLVGEMDTKIVPFRDADFAVTHFIAVLVYLAVTSAEGAGAIDALGVRGGAAISQRTLDLACGVGAQHKVQAATPSGMPSTVEIMVARCVGRVL